MHHDTYTFNREGKPEIVLREPWRWRVIYKDGSELSQFGDDGIFHQFREIDQPNVLRLIMHHDTEPAHIIEVPEGSKLIHFYKNVVLAAATEDQVRVRIFCFGVETPDENLYFAITPDNVIHQLSDFEAMVIE